MKCFAPTTSRKNFGEYLRWKSIDQRIHSAWCKYRSFHKDTHLVLYSLISPEMALSDFCPPINMIWTVTWIGDSWPCCTLFCQSFSIQLFNGLVFQYCSTLNFIMIFIPPMKMILMSTYRGARWRGWKKGKRDNNACVFLPSRWQFFRACKGCVVYKKYKQLTQDQPWRPTRNNIRQWLRKSHEH